MARIVKRELPTPEGAPKAFEGDIQIGRSWEQLANTPVNHVFNWERDDARAQLWMLEQEWDRIHVFVKSDTKAAGYILPMDDLHVEGVTLDELMKSVLIRAVTDGLDAKDAMLVMDTRQYLRHKKSPSKETH